MFYIQSILSNSLTISFKSFIYFLLPVTEEEATTLISILQLNLDAEDYQICSNLDQALMQYA